MSGFGTGSPNFFRCSKCRSSVNHVSPERGWASRVRLTGKSRDRNHPYARNGTVVRQYECQDCGHVGWSSHKDLERLEAQ